MNAIDNSPLLNIDKSPVNLVGFVPVVNFTYDSEAEELTLTSDAITYPAGDDLKIINYRVHDSKGNTVNGARITASGNADTTIDVSSLDLTGPLTATATIVTLLGCIADGSAPGINATNATGLLGSWQITFSTAVG